MIAIIQNIKTWNRKRKDIRKLVASVRPLHHRYCPICHYHGLFSHFGSPPRIDALCSFCGSLERHRLFWLWHEKNSLTEPILHFAPEKIFEQKFRQLYQQYKTADLFNPADLKLNIEQIDLPSDSVNTIICNHVLEHVSDKLALSELYRILSPGGILITSVPLVDGWKRTYENDSITEPTLRELHFGQNDHVRYYGRDFPDRLKEAGFNQIEEVIAYGQDVVDYGLLRGEKFFICRKSVFTDSQ